MTVAADLLAALRVASLKSVDVAGQQVLVRGLTGAERKLIQDRAKAGDPVQAWELVGYAAVQPGGERLFTPEQVADLADVDGALVEKIATAILEASGLLPKSEDDAAKN